MPLLVFIGSREKVGGAVRKCYLGTEEKSVERFKKQPKDFTYDETLKLLSIFWY